MTSAEHKVLETIVREGRAAGQTWAQVTEEVNKAQGSHLAIPTVWKWARSKGLGSKPREGQDAKKETSEQYKARDAIVREGRAAGQTWAEITKKVNAAEGTNLSVGAVLQWAARYFDAVPPRQPRLRSAPSERTLYILAELANGRTLAAIGVELGMTRERVRQIAAAHRTRSHHSPAHIEERREEIETLLRAGEECASVADTTGVPETAVQRIATKIFVRPIDAERRERQAELGRLVDLVRSGVSIRQAAGANSTSEYSLAKACAAAGVKSQTRIGRWNTERPGREAIIREGRAAGQSWPTIAERVSEAEGVNVSGAAMRLWATNNVDARIASSDREASGKCVPPVSTGQRSPRA